jgi:hypothetical protein
MKIFYLNSIGLIDYLEVPEVKLILYVVSIPLCILYLMYFLSCDKI